MTYTSMTANGFLNSIGVNTHIKYTDGTWADIPNVIAELKYLGITNVRDSISNSDTFGSAPLASYAALAAAGIKFTFFIPQGITTTSELQSYLSEIETLITEYPGSIEAIEGPNEINNWAITFNGATGLAGGLALQTAVYNAVKANPLFANIPIVYMTGYGAGSIAIGPDPVSTGIADYDNQHPYPPAGMQPYSSISRSAFPNSTNANEPGYFTETGYSTNYQDSIVQAKYTLNLLFDATNLGITKTYLYDLKDAYVPGSPQGDDGFGLYDYNQFAKPVAYAIHNLNKILADSTPGTVTALNYSVTGLPTNGNSMLLTKSTGEQYIVLWAEPPIWDPVNNVNIDPIESTVTVTLPTTYAVANIYDPLASGSIIASINNVASIELVITDHPILIELKNSVLTTPVASLETDSITVNLSEDAFLGDAQFALSVNGISIVVSQAVTTSHATGDSQPFTYPIPPGTISPTAKTATVAITFLNDRWAGVNADRNLYVESIVVNGITTIENNEQANNGTFNYTVNLE